MSNRFDETLHQIQRQSEEEKAQQLSISLGVAYSVMDDYPFSLDSLRTVPLEVVEEKRYAVYVKTPTQIRVAIVHPEDKLLLDEVILLARKLNCQLELTLVSDSSMRSLIDAYKRLLNEEEGARLKLAEEERAKREKDYLNKIPGIDELEGSIEHVSVSDVLDAILAGAINQRSSDIHIEPEQVSFTVRFRIDGVLHKVLSLPMTHHHQLISRIKMLGKIKIDQNSVSQDGRFSLRDKGIDADIRVSIVPTGYGEGVVMRILQQDGQSLTLPELGFSEYNMSIIEKAIRRPYGMIIVTGPTGSGKSTTLYGILQKLNTEEKKILTLEDPIEYRIKGIQQSQINPEGGFTFAEGLKGALRQDPDVVMVGEIRDSETATIALNASLTGHLVLSTLHTNDAVTAHMRFLELGVEPFLLSGSVQLIIAQRLVRQLVPGCDPAKPEYKGRIVIAEVLSPTQEFEKAVINHTDQVTLREIAKRGGMISMLDDGLAKVKAGVTTEEEVYRVTAA